MTSSTQANLRDDPMPARAGLLLAWLLCACGSGHHPDPAAPEAADETATARAAPSQAAPARVAQRRDDPDAVSDTDAYAAAQRPAADAPRAGAAALSDRADRAFSEAPGLGLQVQLRPNGLRLGWSGAQDPGADRAHASFESVEVRIEGAQGSHAELVPAGSSGSIPLSTLAGGALPDGHYLYEVSPHLPPISGAAPDHVELDNSYADRPLREALRARAGAHPEASAEPELDLDGRDAHDPRIAARKAAALPKARGSFSVFRGALALDEAEPDAPSAPTTRTPQAAPLHR